MSSVLPKVVQDIIVIGAGPCGAGITKALLAENSFRTVKVFEKRANTGGLWNYSSQEGGSCPVPSTDPDFTTEAIPATERDVELHGHYYNSIANDGHLTRHGRNYIWPAAVYDFLDTNVPYDLMAYNNTPWPDHVPIFPHREEVLKYIQEYSKAIEPYVHFGHRVIDVRQLPDSRWQVTSRPVVEETAAATRPSEDPRFQDRVDLADAVVVAVGHYDVPYIPDKNGLKEWHAKFPGSVVHAKAYRSPEVYRGEKNILIVGNSASGADIAYQLATQLDRKIYKSARSANSLPAGKDDRIVDYPDIQKMNAETGEIEFVDGSVLKDVTKVIFATGYLKSLPFLKEVNKSDHPLITDGQRLHGLWRQLLSIHHPGIAVIGLPRFVLPTRLSETQGAWLARVWSGRISLPPKEEMIQWEKDRVAKMGNGKTFHDLKVPDDIIYSNQLNAEIRAAGLDHGYFPVEWDEYQTKIRASVNQIKENYIDYRAKTGKFARSLQELVENNGLVLEGVDPAELQREV